MYINVNENRILPLLGIANILVWFMFFAFASQVVSVAASAYGEENLQANVAGAALSSIVMTPAKSSILSTEPLDVSWNAGTATTYTKDWIALVPEGRGWQSGDPWKYTNGLKTGTITLTPTQPIVQGKHILHYYTNNSFTSLSDGPSVIVQSKVTVDIKANGSDGPITVSEGKPVVISWTSSGATDCGSGGSGSLVSTFWSAMVRPLSGSISIPNATVGDNPKNEFLLGCYNNSSALSSIDVSAPSASDSVVVTVEPVIPTGSVVLKVSKDVIGPTGPIDVSWDAGPVTTYAKDWIALVPYGRTWQSGDPWKYTGGAKTGTLTLSWLQALATGSYQLHYYTNNTFTSLGDSILVSVVSSPSTVKVLSPNGGESYLLDQPVSIKYSSPSVGFQASIFVVDANDLTKSWHIFDVSAGYVGENSVSWVAGDATPGPGKYLMKVCQRFDGPTYTNCDLSDGAFSILPKTLKVLSPNGGETWEVGKTYQIRWDGLKYPTTARVVFGLDVTPTTVVEIGNTTNSGSFNYTVPASLAGFTLGGSTYKILVSVYDSVTGSYVSDRSDAAFKITATDPTSITLTAPNGGQKWQLQNTHTILWSPYDPVNGVNPAVDVSAYLEKLSGGVFTTIGKIIEGGKASIHWIGEIDTFGKYPEPGDYYIRLVNNKTGATDRSDSAFTLVPLGTIKAELKINGSDGPIDVPVGGATYTASWTSSNADSCTLVNGTIDPIDPEFNVTVSPSGIRTVKLFPALYGESSIYDGYISLYCTGTTAVEGFAGDWVVVPAKASLSIVTPNGGETIKLSQDYMISWSSSGINTVNIALYKNDALYKWIVTGIPSGLDKGGGGTYKWSPESMLTSADAGLNYKIYVLGNKTVGGTLEDKSDAPFSIVDDTTSAEEVIVDNLPAGQSGDGVGFTGTWCKSTAPGFYGVDSLYSCGPNIRDTYRWSPALPGTTYDTYEVLAWWTQHTNRSKSVPITVMANIGGVKIPYSVNVNQQINGGKWNSLGTFLLGAGSHVEVSDKNGQANADAIKFKRSGGTTMPVPVYDASTGPFIQGQFYELKGVVSGAKANSIVYFFLQRPDGTLKYSDQPGQDALASIPLRHTDSNGHFSVYTGQTFAPDAQVGTWTSWVTVGGVASNKVYHKVVGASSYSRLPIPTNTLVNGTMTLYRFSLTAPASSNVTLTSFPFSVSSSTVATTSNFALYVYSDSAFSVSATPEIPYATHPTSGNFVMMGSSSVIVPAGTTRYFELRGVVQNAATGSSVSVQFDGLTPQILIK